MIKDVVTRKTFITPQNSKKEQQARPHTKHLKQYIFFWRYKFHYVTLILSARMQMPEKGCSSAKLAQPEGQKERASRYVISACTHEGCIHPDSRHQRKGNNVAILHKQRKSTVCLSPFFAPCTSALPCCHLHLISSIRKSSSLELSVR